MASPLIHSDTTMPAFSRIATSGMHFHLIWGFSSHVHAFLRRPICPQIVKFEDVINQDILQGYYEWLKCGLLEKNMCSVIR